MDGLCGWDRTSDLVCPRHVRYHCATHRGDRSGVEDAFHSGRIVAEQIKKRETFAISLRFMGKVHESLQYWFRLRLSGAYVDATLAYADLFRYSLRL